MSRRLDALVAQFLVERHVGVAVDGRHHRGLLAGRAELLDVRDDGLPVGMAERRVVDHDVLVLHPLQLEVGLEDLVGRARVDVVGADQHPALHLLFLHQVVDGRDRLLVRRGAGVEHVALALLTFVLHRVEQEAVEFLEHRQHRLARHRGPAAEHHRDLVLGDELARLLGEHRPVRGRVDHHRLQLLAEHAALLVLLVDQHQHHVLERGLADRHGARQRMQNADLDGVVGRLGGRCRQQPQHHRGGGRHPSMRPRPLRDRQNGCKHRNALLCLTPAFDAPRSAPRRLAWGKSRKDRASGATFLSD